MESDRSKVWKSAALTKKYLDGVREGIPLAGEQLDVMLRLIQAGGKPAESFLDLACGDGVLAEAILMNSIRGPVEQCSTFPSRCSRRLGNA